MPRYYFNFSDGTHTFTDAAGMELISFADVRTHVIRHIRDLKGALSEHRIQDWAKWKMVVTDANQITILEVGFDLKPKPLNDTGRGALPFAHQKLTQATKT
jgi:hypothetical protein